MSAVGIHMELYRAIESFLYQEARLLDERRFEDWLELFTDHGVYWLPTGRGENGEVEPSILYDDHERLVKRVYRLMHQRVHAQRPPSRTVHVISNIELLDTLEPDANEANEVEVGVRCTLVVYEVRTGNRSQYGLGDLRALAGRARYDLVWDGDKFKIRAKVVKLVDRDMSLYQLGIIV